MTVQSQAQKSRRWSFTAVMLVLLAGCYGYHVYLCAEAPLFFFPFQSVNSDMYANLLWAKSIIHQGWLNPQPHHPYNDWMPAIGTYEQWEGWWGNPRIFQQSPLYAYFLVPFVAWKTDLLYLHMVQGALGILLCYLLYQVALLMSGDRRCGRLTLVLAGFYAPFFVYSWMVLRDLLAWIIMAGLLVLMLKLSAAMAETARARRYALAIGLLLGVGYLAREAFLLVIPLFLVFYAIEFGRRQEWKAPALLALAVLLGISPLLIRNLAVGAPLLSSSNRFAENFIEGNSYNSRPNAFVIPPEMKPILEKTGGKAGTVIVETLRTHPNLWSLLKLQVGKVLSLFDPYEPPDNISIYYFEKTSPFVRWGVKHWMIFTPGLIGLFLILRRRDRRHWPMWLMFAASLVGVFISMPLSRYRQLLALFWIPWAAYAFSYLLEEVRQQRQRSVGLFLLVLFAGWGLSLGPLAKWPKQQYERATEYVLEYHIYHGLKEKEKAQQTRDFLKKHFPEVFQKPAP